MRDVYQYYVEGEDEKSPTALMFRHVVSLAQDLGLEIVVEGVETMKQIELLRENNCTIAQGFYFDKPLPKDEFEARLKLMYNNDRE